MCVHARRLRLNYNVSRNDTYSTYGYLLYVIYVTEDVHYINILWIVWQSSSVEKAVHKVGLLTA